MKDSRAGAANADGAIRDGNMEIFFHFLFRFLFLVLVPVLVLFLFLVFFLGRPSVTRAMIELVRNYSKYLR